MEFNLTTLGILVAVWLVGYLLGLLEAAIKNRNKKSKKDVNIARVDGQDEDNILSAPKVLEPEVLAMFERVSGALKLRLDGEIVNYKSDLTAEQRERLLNLVVTLRPWLDTQKRAKPLAPLLADAKIQTTPRPAARAEVDLDVELVESDYSKLSMVEQIDRILHKKLEGHPLAQRGIQLRTASNGGLLVQVGLDEYEWIDEIPEQPIQEIIREAIAEWEENATTN